MPNDLFKRLPISLAVLQALAMWSNAYALPTGEAIQAGQATFQHNGNTLRIDQSSAKAIVNWQSFNIGQNEAVNLFQPNHGAALFRILGPEASQIFGSLSATGSLFLSNPNGILFAPGSRVDVGSLVATTMRINNADFMSGNYQFYADPNHPDSSVINQGVIRTTDGGYLVLLGNKVENSGSLQANNGSVVLGSAESAVLDFYGDGLVKVNLSGDALNAAIEQTGNITANGGAVQLAVNARTAALNVDGVIQANSLVERNGVIRLEGGANSTVLVSGKLDASGKDSGTKGGNITVTGKRVALLDGATVDVSGSTGGGTALIGGDYQGKNANIQNADRTYIATGASINADALDSGDGGKVVVWADDVTRYYGSISAKGGVNAGNGGFVEVSGKNYLDFNGLVNTFAAYGDAGTLLLDPTNITISTGGNSIESSGATIFQEASSATSILNTTTLQNALALNNVEVTTASPAASAGTITVSNAVGWSSGNSLTLTANSTIAINAAITTGTSASALILNATGNVTQSGTGIIGGQGGLTKNGAGTATLSLANTYTGATNINAGTLTLGAANRIADASAVTVASGAAFNLGNFSEAIGSLAGAGTVTKTGTGAVTLTTGGDNTSTIFSGVIQNPTGSIALTKNGTGTLTLAGNNTYTGTTTINAGTLAAGIDNAISTGAVTVNNGGTYDLNGFSDTIGALTVNSGSTGGTVTTGTGILTLGGNVTSTGGASNALISGNLDLGAANRTFTTTNATDGLTVSAVISGPRNLTKAGNGTLTLSGANTYTGATTINAGTLQLGASGVISDSSALSLANAAGATFDLNGFNETVGSLAGGGTTGGNVTLGAGTLTTGGNNTATTYTGVMSGTGGLTKEGTGAFTLSGNNTYTGATNINAGTLTLGAANRIADASAVTVASGAAFNLGNFSEAIGSLAGAGTVTKTGTGAVTLTTGGDNTSTIFSGVIQNPTGSIALTKNGTGTLTLAGNNTYTGATTIGAGGTLALNATGTIATSSGVTNAGNFTIAANKAIDSMTGAGTTDLGANTLTIGDASNTSSTYSGVASGTGGIVKAGTGTLTLAGTNTYTGATTINAGVLSANVLADGGIASSIGASTNNAANLILSGGTLQYTGGPTAIDRNFTLTASTTSSINVSAGTNLTLSGASTATTGTLTKAGTGTLTLSGTNLYTGATMINAGTLQLGASGVISDSSALSLANAAGATFDLNGFNETVGSLAGGGTTGGNITLGAATLTTGANNATTTYSGIVSGAGGLIKTGTGTQTLSGTNTYTGVTNINAGTLIANNNAALGSTAGGTTVANGATLAIQSGRTVADALAIAGNGVGGTAGALRNISGNNTYSGAITLGGGARINSDAGTLTISGAGNITGTEALTVGGAGNTTISKVIATGAEALNKDGAGVLTLSGANTYTGVTTINAGTLRMGASNVFANASSILVNGGTLDANNRTDTVAGVRLDSGSITGTTGALTSTTAFDLRDGTVSKILNGAVGLNKTTAGTVTLSGANTYTGATNINDGTLIASNANALGTVASGTTVANGATLNINNVAISTEAVNLNGTLTGTDTTSLAGNVTLGSASTIGTTSLASSFGLSGIVNAPFALDITGAGNVTATHANNNFTTVAINGANNVTLRDINAITFGASTINGALSVTSNGAITQTGALNIAGIATLTSGASNDITLNNAGNDFSSVLVSGRNVTVVDADDLTVGTSSVNTINARTLTGNLTLGGNIAATGAGNAIVLASAANFINSGDHTLSPGSGRWLVYSADPATDTRGNALTTASAFKQYNTTYPGTIQGFGNGFIYSVAPTIAATLNGSASKVYDGTTAASIAGLSLGNSGTIDSDIVNLTGLLSANFDTKHVGTNKTLTANGISISSATTSDGKQVYGYQLDSSSISNNSGTVTQATLNLNAVTDTKVYDGTTASTAVVATPGLVGGDSIADLTQSFGSKNVLGVNGSILAVDAGYTVNDGNGGGNYAITENTATGTIVQRTITVSTGDVVKTYDGTTNAAGAATVTVGNLVGGDSLNGGSFAFTDKNFGINNKTVTVGGVTVSDGNGGGNYDVNFADNTSSTINKKDITAVTGITAADKTYDGNSTATLDTSAVGFTGIIGGESLAVTGATGAFNSKDVLTANTVNITSIALADGAAPTDLASNYNLTTTTASDAAIITAKDITAVTGITAADKVYDGNTTATLNTGSAAFTGIIGGETLTIGAATGTFNSKDVVSANTVNITGITLADGADLASNYNLTTTTTSDAAVITTKDITAVTGITGADKIYDGDTTATLNTSGAGFTGIVGGETLTVGSATGTFNNKNVVSANTINITGITLADGADLASNYNLTNTTASDTAVITAKDITAVTGITANNKTYDGNTTATLDTSGAGFTGIISGETLTVGAATGTFNSKDVLTANTVAVSGITLADGADLASNYNLTNNTASTSASVTAKDITAITGITANNKVYDGNTNATLNTGSAGFNGIVGGEILSVGSATGVFNSKDVVSANTVNISGLALADGAALTDLASNYNLTNNTASTSANITPKDITAVSGITAADKTYDGNTTATLNTSGAGFTGIVGGENLTVATATGTFNDKDVLDATTVSITGISLGNGAVPTDLASNYNLTSTIATDSAVILAKDITAVTGITAADKTYDGNMTATLNTTGADFTGIISGESLTVGAATGTFNSKDVVTASTVAISGITLADGADLASNYNLTNATASDAAMITAKDITAVTGITAADKIYDGNTTATLNTSAAGFTGIVAGESLTVGAATGTFNSKDVVTANTVAITGITLADGVDLASNYNLVTDIATDTAVITPRAITITTDAGQTKVYGSVDPIFTFTVGGLGIATGDALSGNLNRAAGETVGAYAMNQGSLAVPDASNYIVTYIGNDFNVLQPASVTGLPNTSAGLVDLNPKLGAYTGPQLFILSLAPSAAGGDGTSADANLPQCESNPDKLAKDKDFSIMINYGLNLPKGLGNTCI